MTKTSRDRILARIAIEVLRISTLKTRKGSSLDFHEVAVWELHRALELAFMMGQRAGSGNLRRALSRISA